MNNFKKGGFRQGGGGSGGRSKFGNKFGGGRGRDDRRPGGRMELFPAVCFECKKNCEVPFRPTGDKPVYCRDCFGKQEHIPGRNSSGSDRPSGDFRRDVRPQHEYQSEPVRAQSDDGIGALKRQLAALELKVNRILELVSQKTESSVFKVPVVHETSKVAKATKVKTPARKVAKK